MKKLTLICVLVGVFASFAAAQDNYGTIGGTILDPSNAAVPKAKVTVTNTDRNQVIRTVTTDSTGVYSAPLLPVGMYSLKVEAGGFRSESRTGIKLNVADELKINITLQVGTLTDVVEVKEQAIPVETGTATAATTIDGEQV